MFNLPYTQVSIEMLAPFKEGLTDIPELAELTEVK